MATSGTLYSNYIGNFHFTFEWNRTGYSIVNNENYISYKVVAHNTVGNYRTVYDKSLYIAGVNKYENASGQQLKEGDVVTSGNVTIKAADDGSCKFLVNFNSKIGASTYGDDCYIYTNCTVDTIPRDAITDSKPEWTAPGGVTCVISRASTNGNRVLLQLKNASNNWVDCGDTSGVTLSTTFVGETVMKQCFTVLNGRASCAARFAVYTSSTNKWNYGPEGTCTAATANTVTAPNFTAIDSATTTITKGNNSFTTTLDIKINGQTIGSTSQSSATSFTFNNTVALRKACFTGLAQSASKSYTITATTYYAGVKVRSSTSASGTITAPNANTVTAPDFMAMNSATTTITKGNSAFTTSITVKINGQTIGTTSQNSSTSFIFNNTTALKKACVTGLAQTNSKTYTVTATTYYEGVQVRSSTSASGTCSAPNVNTVTAPTFIATNSATTTITKAHSDFTTSITVTINGQTIGTTSQNSGTSFTFNDSTSLRARSVKGLAQTASKQYTVTATTYYEGVQIRSSVSTNGTCNAPAANTVNAPNFVAIDSNTTTITKGDSATTTTILVQIGGQTIGSATQTTKTSFTFNDTTALRKACVTGLSQATSKTYTITATTYYKGVQVRSATSASGTCSAPNATTVTAPTFTATNSATTTITKANSSLTTKLSVTLNGKNIGSTDNQISATTFTFNNTTALRKACIEGLAQTNSKEYTITFTTYYEGVQVGSSKTQTGICNAPAVDTVTAPTFTAGNNYSCTVITASSELSRKLTFQIQNSAETWITIVSQAATTSTSFTWGNTEAQLTTIFNALGTAASRSTRVLVTTYYSGVQVRSADVATTGTCTAPSASTCTKPTWTAGTTFTCTVSRASSLLTHTIDLQVKNSSGSWQTLQSITKSSSTSISFVDTTTLNTTLFNYLAQAASRDTRIQITTYYKNSQVRDTITIIGTVTAPAASTCTTTPNWTGGDNLTLQISRANSAFTHTVVVKVNSQTVTTLTNVGSSTSFGTSESDRINIFTALAQASSKASSVIITTYYNGIQVRTATTKGGTCSAPDPIKINAPTWTAGNSLTANITLSKSYLAYDVELKVGDISVQKYLKQTTATTLKFAETVEQNIKAYEGLATQPQAASYFDITMYYNNIQVGPTVTKNGICTALAANTASAPQNWIAGSPFTITVTRASTNLYTKLVLKIGSTVIETKASHTNANKNYTVKFAETKDINKTIYTTLAQAVSKNATLEITTYYGTETNQQQVRTTGIVSGVCKAADAATVKTLTFTPNSGIIDNTKVDYTIFKATPNTTPTTNYTTVTTLLFNNEVIHTFDSTTSTSLTFNTSSYKKQIYQKIPKDREGKMKLRITTYYEGIQVRQPTESEEKVLYVEDGTVSIKMSGSLTVTTAAKVVGHSTNSFIDNTSMIGSSMSTLELIIPAGLFYMDTNYGGYIRTIQLQIASNQAMTTTYSYTEANNVKSSPAFSGNNKVVLGPYAFEGVTTPAEPKSLIITATDSRGYTKSYTINLTIFPYKAPTIAIDNKKTDRKSLSEPTSIVLKLDGTLSTLHQTDNGTIKYTNKIKNLTIKYRIYGSNNAYEEVPIIQNGSNKTTNGFEYPTTNFNSYKVGTGTNRDNGWTLTKNGTVVDFNINNTYELITIVEDYIGNITTDTIIILPNRPSLSFREGRIGINIIPRTLKSITGDPNDTGAPALDVNGYIYSNDREVPTFSITSSWTG